MLLSIQDRVYLVSLMPEQDSIPNLLIRREIIDKVKISEQEATEINLKQEKTILTWDKKAEEKEIDITQQEKEYIHNCISDLSSRRSFHDQLLNLYFKFK